MNRNYGLGNSKYAIILDLLHTGQVTQSMRSELLAFNMANASLTVQDRHMVAMDQP